MSNYLGQAVLAMIQFHGGDEFNLSNDYVIEPYVNCREQGFHIKNWKLHRAVSFSENRNSDQIVVYWGEDGYNSFSPQGNVPSENIYNNHVTYYSYRDVSPAARSILGFLMGESLEII